MKYYKSNKHIPNEQYYVIHKWEDNKIYFWHWNLTIPDWQISSWAIDDPDFFKDRTEITKEEAFIEIL